MLFSNLGIHKILKVCLHGVHAFSVAVQAKHSNLQKLQNVYGKSDIIKQ